MFFRLDKGVIVYICDSRGVRDIYDTDGSSALAASEPLTVLVHYLMHQIIRILKNHALDICQVGGLYAIAVVPFIFLGFRLPCLIISYGLLANISLFVCFSFWSSFFNKKVCLSTDLTVWRFSLLFLIFGTYAVMGSCLGVVLCSMLSQKYTCILFWQ